MAFADYDNGDYRLNKSGSVLKGAGTTRDVYDTYAISPTDLIGTPWGSKKLDIGCYAAKAAGLMLILR